jgi:MoaA/NifB/PqqE/SkfB family radical SAM enzyme
VELNEACNLRCEHCSFWKTDFKLVLSKEAREDIIATFADMGGETVVTCGGEASLEGESFWEHHASARRHALRSFTVTNGTRITEKNVQRWLTEGPTEITVSIDSHDPTEHDKWRGLPNWHVATGALRRLLVERVAGGPRVFAMTIVGERNYRDLPKLFDLVLGDIGADKLKLNIAQMTFGATPPGGDEWFAANAPRDADDLLRVIETCDEKWGIQRNPQWKRDVWMYCNSVKVGANALLGRRSVGQTERNICNSGERNIWINHKGVAQLCPSHKFPGAKVRTGEDLRNFWKNASWRGEMAECRDYCGISHSVRREPSTMRVPG